MLLLLLLRPMRPDLVNQLQLSDVTPMQQKTHLCRSLDLGESLALLETALLLEAQDLEALKVRQVLPPVVLVALLSPVGLVPLVVNFRRLPLLLQLGMTGATVKVLDNEGREESPGEAKGLSAGGELGVGGGALDEHLYIRFH